MFQNVSNVLKRYEFLLPTMEKRCELQQLVFVSILECPNDFEWILAASLPFSLAGGLC